MKSCGGGGACVLAACIFIISFSHNGVSMAISISRLHLIFGFLLSAAGFYTWKIDHLDRAGELSLPGHALLAWWDALPIAALGLAVAILLPFGTKALPRGWAARRTQGRNYFFLAALLMFLWRIPFLLAFYPAPGMNDTVFMMENPLYASVQFPWFYSLLYGYGSEWGKEILGTREPVIFIFSLVQAAAISVGLTAFAYWIRNHVHPWAGHFLYGYFLLFPMVGNYSIAAVRDGFFSLALLFWVWIFLREWEKENWGRESWLLFGAALLGTMLFRSNGLLVSLVLTATLYISRRNKKILFAFLLAAILSAVPGQFIQRTHHWEPLFQESMAIPLQQMGRVAKLDGERSEETISLMNGILSDEEWKKEYSPYTVDFVKWHDHFRRNQLNQEKGEFLKAWAETGLANPRIYVEGWLTETYALWNLDPLEYSVQSRFGWALTDENTKDMKPKENDQMAVGDFPMPAKWKAFFGNMQYEGSRFIGPGLALWFTLFAGLLFYERGERKLILALLPLWANTATLLLSTPASAVFRYSFAYVLVLPVVFVYVVFTKEV